MDTHVRLRYCCDAYRPTRRLTHEVCIGDLPLGATHPIRIQSMTTTNTLDVQATVAQIISLSEQGSEYVRLTVPSQKEAHSLREIQAKLSKHNCKVPLIADIHFTPKAAELAAEIVEKVRINPGNYADKKSFAVIEYTESSYQAALERIAERVTPLIKICKRNGTVLRIGTNHGSLSDRIMSRYGDTPIGMVESALEFLRICESLSFYDVVLSMKASQPRVMVQAYRLLVQRLEEEDMRAYPLHLGVTEAGDGEDGRLKSAVGIGTLLSEGLGDTIRVSLTEDPVHELPVADTLRNQYSLSPTVRAHKGCAWPTGFSPFEYKKRTTHVVHDWHTAHAPRVICDVSQLTSHTLSYEALGYQYMPDLDKWKSYEQACDYMYTGNWGDNLVLPRGLQQVLDYETWIQIEDKQQRYPLLDATSYALANTLPSDQLLFLSVNCHTLKQEKMTQLLKKRKRLVLLLRAEDTDTYQTLREAFFVLSEKGFTHPVCIFLSHQHVSSYESLLYRAAVDVGGLLLDGYGEGICLRVTGIDTQKSREAAFSLLQVLRLRVSRTEYIACPSCGRTLFDLEKTTARIRAKTSHLKGLKIGIMGCIVNGPGEMADADYGYVGSGKDRITLYKGKEVVQRNIATKDAVEALIHMIKQDGKWRERIQD